jgi:enamine deaminase RidA (YjgF/YER057c/UK114 family)
MSATGVRAPRREDEIKSSPGRVLLATPGRSGATAAKAGPNFSHGEECCAVDLGDSARLALMVTPESRGEFREQAEEVFSAAHSILQRQVPPMTITLQTIFLREASDRQECERMLAAHFGSSRPVTNFVLQPPCGGAAMALEAWAIGGKTVRVERFGPHTLAVSYDSVRWVYCAGVTSAGVAGGVYNQTRLALEQMREDLVRAGGGFEQVVRTWFYLGGISEREAESQRYHELNRARSDFYRKIPFCRSLLGNNGHRAIYPASTGIGMSGAGLVTSCVALQTDRKDAFVAPLENPLQTPAYAYHPRYSSQSPKFSRAMALVLGDYVTTWISGTASIVNSETRHPGDVAKQTEQTIDNIERLIAPNNFAAHGIRGAGASLRDLAKIRVYLKTPEDFIRCRAICERRFGAVPAIYAAADVCRPELLVEIEGVAFSRRIS